MFEISHNKKREALEQFSDDDPRKLKRIKVHRRIPEGDFISVTNENGQRVYCSLRPSSDIVPLDVLPPSWNLIPIQELKRQIREEQSKKFKKKENQPSVKESQKELWVAKYAPNKYIDLISEESINRDLLKWLKLWDGCVFGKSSIKENKSLSDGKGQEFHAIDDQDRFKRPFIRAVLIHGPPGLGKTTLAHVLAKKAGYRVVEMNASDDRSVDAFREKLESSTQIEALSLPGAPPNLLVIDEIDGAPQPAVDVLVFFIKRGDSKSEGVSKKRIKKTLGPMRPIICICNDPYVPSLRGLRVFCHTILIKPPHPQVLSDRLFHIAKKERLKTDPSALRSLCEKTDNDIRSCINTLQFIGNREGKVTSEMLKNIDINLRDKQKSYFSLLQSIFSLPSESKLSNFASSQPKPPVASRLLPLLNSSSLESNRLEIGLFDNYLLPSISDQKLSNFSEALEGFLLADQMNCYISSNQNYSFLKYSFFLPLSLHLLLASRRCHRINFSKSQLELQQKMNRVSEGTSTLLQETKISIKRFLSPSLFLLEVNPFLIQALRPTLRPVNVQLFSSQEKNVLQGVVSLMLNYNLSYKQTRNEEGNLSYSLDPNIENLSCFRGLENGKCLTYTCKQMIGREVDQEKIKKNDLSFNYDTLRLHPAIKSSRIKKAPQDFFGRTIDKIDVKEVEKANVVSVFGNVWYKYKEGFTNAVRRTAKLRQFL